MSFTHFRLGINQPLPPHLQLQTTVNNLDRTQPQNSIPQPTPQFVTHIQTDNSTQFINNQPKSHSSKPYGSGDADDGYTLVFKNLDEFNAWKAREEETQVVEFVKGDTHGSKAVPPRFKEHTKLVCARHSRSGRKKYVKKHPERVRKVPSRKLEGVGCPASISFKTYYDSEEVRACYSSQHSHEIGLANLPFTRRGRRAAVQEEKERVRKGIKFAGGSASAPPAPSTSAPPAAAPPLAAAPSSYGSISMMASMPTAPVFPAQPAYAYPPAMPAIGPIGQGVVGQDRWDNMASLFTHIREHARGFEFTAASVAALETVLIRLYIESPMMNGAPVPPMLQGMGQPPQAHFVQPQNIQSTNAVPQPDEEEEDEEEDEDGSEEDNS